MRLWAVNLHPRPPGAQSRLQPRESCAGHRAPDGWRQNGHHERLSVQQAVEVRLKDEGEHEEKGSWLPKRLASKRPRHGMSIARANTTARPTGLVTLTFRIGALPLRIPDVTESFTDEVSAALSLAKLQFSDYLVADDFDVACSSTASS